MGCDLEEVPAPMITAIVIATSFIILFVLIWRVIHAPKTDSEVIFHLNAKQRTLDLDALALLLSATENEYLRRSLPKERFRQVRRERISVARSYLRAIRANTRQFTQAAEAVESSTDPELARAAHELMLIALRVRLNMPLVQLSLMMEWLFPSLSLGASTKLDGYRAMSGNIIVMLDRLGDGTPRISAS